MNLSEVYEKSEDFENAQNMLEKALKKYKKSKKVWMAYQHYLLRRGDDKGAKSMLGRSMQSLSRHKHVEVITQYGLKEFEYGSMDRGRVIFEELLNSYPKRSDLWHIYVDKEVKYHNIPQARQLFERAIASKYSSKNMKTIFKKFLTFESTHGSEASIDEVKEKARVYVSSLM